MDSKHKHYIIQVKHSLLIYLILDFKLHNAIFLHKIFKLPALSICLNNENHKSSHANCKVISSIFKCKVKDATQGTILL